MRYRTRLDILCEMLQTAQSKSLQTKIMYGTNTSHAQMKKYLKVLLQEELLTYDATEKRYHTTEKGMQFMKKYQEMKQILFSKQSR